MLGLTVKTKIRWRLQRRPVTVSPNIPKKEGDSCVPDLLQQFQPGQDNQWACVAVRINWASYKWTEHRQEKELEEECGKCAWGGQRWHKLTNKNVPKISPEPLKRHNLGKHLCYLFWMLPPCERQTEHRTCILIRSLLLWSQYWCWLLW